MSHGDSAEDEGLRPYEPPLAAWRLPAFVEAPLAEVEAKVVECRTCPVFLMCEAGQGGTGWTCASCRATGVLVDVPGTGTVPEDVLLIDCGRHQFWTREAAVDLTRCDLCSGRVMDLELRARGSKQHYIATVHARVPVAERQKNLREAYEYWNRRYAAEEEGEGGRA